MGKKKIIKRNKASPRRPETIAPRRAKTKAKRAPLMTNAELTHIDPRGQARMVEIDNDPEPALPGLLVRATVKVTGQTGVEMEALVAVSIACLTIYDMIKAVERGMRIEGIRLLEKRGGKSGDYRAEP